MSKELPHILMVEDEPSIAELLRFTMQGAGFATTIATDVAQARKLIAESLPHVVLLDWMLPDSSGLVLLSELRRDQRTAALPVIMLTAKGVEEDKVKGLNEGADDYVTKPFSPRELVARLKAVLRRAGPTDGEAPIEVGGLILDPISHRVTIDGTPAEMGPTEYRLLQFFMTHQERAYTRGQLLDQVWGGNVYVEERTVDVHIRRLRKALGDDYENQAR